MGNLFAKIVDGETSYPTIHADEKLLEGILRGIMDCDLSVVYSGRTQSYAPNRPWLAFKDASLSGFALCINELFPARSALSYYSALLKVHGFLDALGAYSPLSPKFRMSPSFPFSDETEDVEIEESIFEVFAGELRDAPLGKVMLARNRGYEFIPLEPALIEFGKNQAPTDRFFTVRKFAQARLRTTVTFELLKSAIDHSEIILEVPLKMTVESCTAEFFRSSATLTSLQSGNCKILLTSEEVMSDEETTNESVQCSLCLGEIEISAQEFMGLRPGMSLEFDLPPLTHGTLKTSGTDWARVQIQVDGSKLRLTVEEWLGK